MDEKEQIKPLTLAPHSADEEAASDAAITAAPSKWYFIVRVFCGCSAVIATLGLALLVLTFTAFRVKDPNLTVNTIYFHSLKILLATPNPSQPISINATLIADISVENPNVESLQFDSSVTRFYYLGETVGVAYAPWSKVSGKRTLRMNVTVEVLADRMGMLANAASSAMAYGYVNLTSYTDVRGRVSVMGIFNRKIEVVMNCSMSLDVPLSSQQVKKKDCQAYVE